MSANKYLSYVYLIGWSKLDLWYIGVRYAQTKRRQDYDLWIDYFTHSIPVKHMRAFIGEPDIIHYDKIFDSKEEAIEYELEILKEHDVKNNSNFLNKSIGKASNYKRTKEINEKTSKSNKNPSEKTRQKMSENNKGRNNPMYGISHTEKAKLKIGIASKNRKITKKARINISKSKLGIKNPMYGKPSHNRRKVIIKQVLFNSVKEAADYNKVSRNTIRYWIKKDMENILPINIL